MARSRRKIFVQNICTKHFLKMFCANKFGCEGSLKSITYSHVKTLAISYVSCADLCNPLTIRYPD